MRSEGSGGARAALVLIKLKRDLLLMFYPRGDRRGRERGGSEGEG